MSMTIRDQEVATLIYRIEAYKMVVELHQPIDLREAKLRTCKLLDISVAEFPYIHASAVQDKDVVIDLRTNLVSLP